MRCFVFIVVFFAFALEAFGQQSSEDYRVYDAVIRHMFAGDIVAFDTRASVKEVVIRDQTNTDFAFSKKKENWDQIKIRLRNQLTDEVIADFELKQKSPIQLTRSFAQTPKFTFISQKEYDTIFDAKGDFDRQAKNWSKFYEKYPDSGGYILLSNVGYNKMKDEALVYFVHWCGTLCGTGHYVLVEKVDEKWEVWKKEMIWIS